METITIPVSGTRSWCGRCGAFDDGCHCPPLAAVAPYAADAVTPAPDEAARIAALPSGAVLLGPEVTHTIDLRALRAAIESQAGQAPTCLAMTERSWSALLAQIARDERATRRRRRMRRKARRGWA